MKVFLHTKKDTGEDWKNEERVFKQIPAVGDYILPLRGSLLYEVRLVIHIPKDAESDFDAEVFSVESAHSEAQLITQCCKK
jgi:hypothetical protein